MREITSEKVVVAFSFASDWSRGWRFSRPITDSKNAEESSSGLLSTLSCKFAFKAKGEWVSEFPALKVYFVFEFFCALILLLLYFLSCLFHDCPSRGFGSRHSKNALWDAVTLLHSVFRLVWSEIIVRFYSFSVRMGRYYWWNVRPHGQSTLPY